MTETLTDTTVDWDAELHKIKVHRTCPCHRIKPGAPAFCGHKILGVERTGYDGKPCVECVRLYAIGFRCRYCNTYWRAR